MLIETAIVAFALLGVDPLEPSLNWKAADFAPVLRFDPPAQQPVVHHYLMEGDNYITGSIGFTDSPDTFLVGVGYSHFFQDRLAIGPLVQMGFDDDFTLIAPTLDVKYFADIDNPNLSPFIHGGAGFITLTEDHAPGDDTETGFLLNLGFGLDYRLSDKVSIGTDMLFNFMPNEVMDEHFFFSWQVVSISFHF